jgi:hypothetical protein
MKLYSFTLRFFQGTFIALVLSLTLSSCGGGGGGGSTTAESSIPTPTSSGTTADSSTPTPTAPGTPTGTAITKTIDANGGTITSTDGQFSVIIPAGALSASTDITIQPITNTAPEGDASVTNYRLLPDGTTFAAPVTLTFNIPDDEVEAIDSAFIATQNADGIWYEQPGTTRDPTSKNVSVTTTHFTDWALLRTLYISPRVQYMKPGTDRAFLAYVIKCTARGCASQQFHSSGGDIAVWAAAAGTITGSEDSASGVNSSYVAPSSVPNPNPVIIKLTVSNGSFRVAAVARAYIYEKEIWTGQSDLTLSDGTKIHASFTFIQDDPDPSPTLLLQHYNVQNGQVTITPPPGTPCTTTPLTHAIAPDDGELTVDYTDNPISPFLNGFGITKWTVTSICSGQSKDNPLGVTWFPPSSGHIDPNQTGIDLTDFSFTPGVTGKVHLENFDLTRF